MLSTFCILCYIYIDILHVYIWFHINTTTMLRTCEHVSYWTFQNRSKTMSPVSSILLEQHKHTSNLAETEHVWKGVSNKKVSEVYYLKGSSQIFDVWIRGSFAHVFFRFRGLFKDRVV